MKIVSCHTADSKPVKQEVNGTVILPPLAFPDCMDAPMQCCDSAPTNFATAVSYERKMFMKLTPDGGLRLGERFKSIASSLS